MWRFVFVFLCSVLALPAHDWPQLLGPDRNGRSAETNLNWNWGKEGPRIVWRKTVGQGWSAPVVSSNRVISFHRQNDREAVECVDAMSGAPLWKAEYKTDYRDDFGFDEGPRATPAISGIRVFTFGANGVLSAWNLTNGARLWQINTRKEFGNDKGFFGIACSPLVEGNAVILNIGGRNDAGIVAFNAANGAVLWKTTDEEAGYSSPVAATFAGKRRLLVLTRGNLVALEPGSGKVMWKFPFRPAINASVTAATPLVIGDSIFISASYGAGAAMLRFGEMKPEVLWQGDDVLSNHYATSVAHGGLLFGFDGRQEQKCNLRCVDAKTGKIRWSEDRFGAGTLLGVGDRLLILTERGELIAANATTEKFQPTARAQVLGVECRANVALANGLFYARDKNALICVDLRQHK
ncbi:MAG TPA: PQQ-binding-like beta-propeller repeat protein [Candidatus Acidoferrum sp.]|nr:PQQ-binding-like beta-propeller repeat protein [Candidatus Acidoferrum sp.]